ncbi:MAG: hypothetical protein Q4A71_07235 [Actinomycetaceae bacterium]|nr:hypothetical protein [Actinomycetaceae bacterium]
MPAGNSEKMGKHAAVTPKSTKNQHQAGRHLATTETNVSALAPLALLAGGIGALTISRSRGRHVRRTK